MVIIEEIPAGGRNVRRKADDSAKASLPVMPEGNITMRKVPRSRLGFCCGEKHAAPLPAEGDQQVVTTDYPDWPGKHIVEQGGVLNTHESTLPSLSEEMDANQSEKRRKGKGVEDWPILSAWDNRMLLSEVKEAIIPKPGDAIHSQTDVNGESSRRIGVFNNPLTIASEENFDIVVNDLMTEDDLICFEELEDEDYEMNELPQGAGQDIGVIGVFQPPAINQAEFQMQPRAINQEPISVLCDPEELMSWAAFCQHK